MITGAVNADLEATIPLIVRDANAQEQEIEVLIDTGFSGFLTLPPSLIASLGLTWRGQEPGILADGSMQLFDVYAATVIWDGQPRTVETDAAETEPLIGMGLIEGHDLRIQAIAGGTVTIEALP
ncbi:MAG: clan AA aspartic protease [Armatimonadota bacterium]|nr:clan AA aspartic protease [Armatimonadota bacterium]